MDRLMRSDPRLFGQLLSMAVRVIAAREDKTIASIQDELGYAVGKSGGTAIEYWRKGHVPAVPADGYTLIQEVGRRARLSPEALTRLAASAGFNPQVFVASAGTGQPMNAADRPASPFPTRGDVVRSPVVVRPPCGQANTYFCLNGWCVSAGVCRAPRAVPSGGSP